MVIWNWASHWVLVIWIRVTVVTRRWVVRHMGRMVRMVRGVWVVVVHLGRWIIAWHVRTILRVKHRRTIVCRRIILRLTELVTSDLAVLLQIWLAMRKVEFIQSVVFDWRTAIHSIVLALVIFGKQCLVVS